MTAFPSVFALFLRLYLCLQSLDADATLTSPTAFCVHYGFDGNTADDGDYGSFDGELIGTAQYTLVDDGRDGQALSFDGNSCVQTGTWSMPSEQISFSAWVLPYSFTDPYNDNRILTKASGTAIEDHVFMLSGTNDGGYRWRARLSTDEGGYITLFSTSTASLFQWAHVGVTYDGFTVSLWVNGVVEDSGSLSGRVRSSYDEVLIGCQADKPSWDGLIDDVRICGSVLDMSAVFAENGVFYPGASPTLEESPTEADFSLLGDGRCRTAEDGVGSYEALSVDLDTCIRECRAQPSCVGIEYKFDDIYCELHTDALTHVQPQTNCVCYVHTQRNEVATAPTTSTTTSPTQSPTGAPTPSPTEAPTTSAPTSSGFISTAVVTLSNDREMQVFTHTSFTFVISGPDSDPPADQGVDSTEEENTIVVLPSAPIVTSTEDLPVGYIVTALNSMSLHLDVYDGNQELVLYTLSPGSTPTGFIFLGAACDGNPVSGPATMTLTEGLTVACVYTYEQLVPVELNDDTATVEVNSMDNVIPVLKNDDLGSLPANIVRVADPPNGSAAINLNGTPSDPLDDYVDYTPDTGFCGMDTFDYTVTDENGDSAQATAAVSVDCTAGLWQQEGADHERCENTGDDAVYTGDQQECQSRAISAGSTWYSYAALSSYCFHSTTCDSPTTTSWDYARFHKAPTDAPSEVPSPTSPDPTSTTPPVTIAATTTAATTTTGPLSMSPTSAADADTDTMSGASRSHGSDPTFTFLLVCGSGVLRLLSRSL